MNQSNKGLGIVLGIALLIGMHMLVFSVGMPILLFLSERSSDPYAGLSALVILLVSFFLWQLLYVIPAVLFFRRRGNREVAKGLIIGAVITALLNGSCSIILFSQ